MSISSPSARALSAHRSLLLLLALACASGVQAHAQDSVPSAASADTSVAPAAPAQDATASSLADARAMLSKADYTAADTSLRETLRQRPRSADAWFLLGFALLHEHKPTDAIAAYMQGATLREPGADELIGFAAAQSSLRQGANAERSLLAAARLAPERPVVWYLLGRAQFDQAHWQDAERSFASCLRLDPHNVQAQTSLGLVDEKLQRADAAAAAYRAAIALEETIADKDPQPYLALGMLLRRQGKLAEALPMLTMATWARIPDPLAHQELGLAYEQLRRYDQALGELRTAVYLAPNDASLHFFLGRIERETGHQEQAAEEFAAAARLAATPQVAATSSQSIH